MTSSLVGRFNPPKLVIPAVGLVQVAKPPVDLVQRLAGAVIVIARSAAGAGADTLASLLRNALATWGCATTLVDFSERGDEGPAWDRTGVQYNCVRVAAKGDLGPEIGNVVAERSNETVIINTPKNFLADLASAEEEYFPIIRGQGRLYRLLWIDHPHDEPSDILLRYIALHGGARCVVLRREPDHSGVAVSDVNVALPEYCSGAVSIPRLPSAIAEAFYRGRMNLDQAIGQGRVGDKMALATRRDRFLTDLRREVV